MDKVCEWCGTSKLRVEFAGRWGQSKYCKICQPIWRREDDRKRHADPDYMARARARRRERYATESAYAEERKQAAHQYRQQHPEHVAAKKREWAERNPEKMVAAIRRSQARHPDHVAARLLVKRALKLGVVSQQPCWCGDPRSYAHHHNGYVPEHILDVVWLCRKHHVEQHRKYPRKE